MSTVVRHKPNLQTSQTQNAALHLLLPTLHCIFLSLEQIVYIFFMCVNHQVDRYCRLRPQYLCGYQTANKIKFDPWNTFQLPVLQGVNVLIGLGIVYLLVIQVIGQCPYREMCQAIAEILLLGCIQWIPCAKLQNGKSVIVKQSTSVN